ncbi:MAG: nitrate reductase molybdenum cofactor assembly chaperone [Candidatus Binatia bacterium]
MSLASCKVLGALLLYPSSDLLAAVDEIERRVAAEPRLSAHARDGVARLLAGFREGSLLDLEEAWVATFDHGRACSLHLFEHVHGEARERGQAMVDLRRLYVENGLEPSTTELPDYLPLLCEFLSLAPESVARPLLDDAAPILAALRRKLELRLSPYAAVLEALIDLAGDAVDRAALRDVEQAVDATEESELERLDREWEEPVVDFTSAGAADAAAATRAGRCS